jgi:phage tail-like protein
MDQYLNHDNRWPRVRTFGLEVERGSGALTLRRLAGPPRRLAGVPGVAAARPAAAGVAAGPDGSIYLSDPEGDRVLILEPGAGRARPLREECGPGPAADEGRFAGPFGLAVQRCRNRLLVCDRGNRRIQVLEGGTGRVVDVWELAPRLRQPARAPGRPALAPAPAPAPGRAVYDAVEPEQVACDARGDAYVVVHATGGDPRGSSRRALVKLSRDGSECHAFGRRSLASLRPDNFTPRYVATARWRTVYRPGTREVVLVLGTVDGQQPGAAGLRVVILELDGRRARPNGLDLVSLTRPPERTVEAALSVIPSALDGGPGSRAGGSADLGDRLRGFAAAGATLYVGLAPGDAGSPCGPEEPDRVWAYDVGAVLRGGLPSEVERSTVTLDSGPVAALGTRRDGTERDLLRHAGAGRELLALPFHGAYRTQGAFLAGPFPGDRGRVTRWDGLRFEGELPGDSRLQLFTLSRNEAASVSGDEPGWAAPFRPRVERLPGWFRLDRDFDLLERLGFGTGTEPPPDPAPDARRARSPREARLLADPDLVAPGRWAAAPEGQPDVLLRNGGGTDDDPADQLWVFGVLGGDGLTSPRFVQARLGHDDDSWLGELPAVYRRNPVGESFLRSLLGLLASGFADVTGSIDRLPALFSPDAVLARYGPRSPETDWLRASLALPEFGRARDRHRVRRLFAEGVRRLARRATPDGLRRLIRLATGVEAHIDEPGLAALPTRLGADSAPAGGPAQSALAAAAADGTNPRPPDPGCPPEPWPEVLGQAVLRDPDRPALALPADLAHHFVVRGYLSDLADPEARDAVDRAVRRLAPAHATWSLQVIEPRLRVGVQARLGVDAVVGTESAADPRRLSVPPGRESRLSPTPPPPTRLGSSHLGDDAILQ